MDAGIDLQIAWDTHVSSDSSLAMIGWQDSDGDGVFDVLDVPLSLTGVGHYDPVLGLYQFVGHSEVGTLRNVNSSGRRNDITVNEVSQVVYSLDGGSSWTVAENYDTYEADIDIRIPLAPENEILIRTESVDPITGKIVVTSDQVFHGSTSLPTALIGTGIQGFVWYDQDANGQWDLDERGVPGWSVHLVDANGAPIETAEYLEPDEYADEEVVNTVLNGVTLTAVGNDVKDGRVGAVSSAVASTGDKVLGLVRYATADDWVTEWTSDSRTLRIDFDLPTTYVSVDAMSAGGDAYARLEIYDTSGQLIERTTSGLLGGSAVETVAPSTVTPQISYALVRSLIETSILLDNLQLGPAASAVTGPSGSYALPNLPAGQYHVMGVPTADWDLGDPVSGIVDVTVAADGSMDWDVGTDRPSDFGARPSEDASPWKNLIAPLDVNDDRYIRAARRTADHQQLEHVWWSRIAPTRGRPDADGVHRRFRGW